MNVGIIGSGRIGSNIGRRAAAAGHAVIFSFARDAQRLADLAREVGQGARSGTPAEAARADIVVFATPWEAIDDALAAAGTLAGRVVIDTSNPFGADGLIRLDGDETSGQHNARRMPGAKLVKAFNTLTAGYQATAHDTPGEFAMFIAGDDYDAKQVAGVLVRALGFEPVDIGILAGASMIDAPRRDGAVYGEAYRVDDAREFARLLLVDQDAAAQLATARRV